eukprot:COSAG04_NODE_4161_length_2263_cov_1.842421_1_plen_81_part_10
MSLSVKASTENRPAAMIESDSSREHCVSSEIWPYGKRQLPLSSSVAGTNSSAVLSNSSLRFRGPRSSFRSMPCAFMRAPVS